MSGLECIRDIRFCHVKNFLNEDFRPKADLRARTQLESHGRISDRRDVAANVNSLNSSLSENLNVQDASTSHFASLFAYEARPVSVRYETMPHHEYSEWARGASGRWIFGNAVFRREHARVSPFSSL